MALTITRDIPSPERISRNLGLITGSIAFDSSYPTGGEEASGITGLFKHCLRIICDAKGGYVFEWDETNGKIKVLYPQGGEQVGAADGGASVDTGAVAVTSSAANGAIVTVNAGKGREVANATDLSSLTGVSFIAIGLI